MLWLGETRYSIDRPRYIVYTDDRSLTMPPYKLARSIRVANLARVATSLGEQPVHRARKPWSRVNCVDRFPSFRQACFPKPNISKGYFLWQNRPKITFVINEQWLCYLATLLSSLFRNGSPRLSIAIKRSIPFLAGQLSLLVILLLSFYVSLWIITSRPSDVSYVSLLFDVKVQNRIQNVVKI